MDISEEITDPLTIDERVKNDDIEFCSFYYKAIKRLLDIDNKANVSYLHRYFKIFSDYYDFWCQEKPYLQDHDDTIVKILEDSLYYRIAYIYRNATLLSSTVAFHFRNIYKQSPKNIEKLTAKTLVKICSIGGCAASDIVAIVTVLESIALKNGTTLDFRVAIIEPDERWKVTCITILSCLKQFHRATWKITFIPANLNKKKAWTPEVYTAIQEADIVTMVRFLSKFNHKAKIMRIICGKLQPGALLSVLDRPLTDLIKLCFGITYTGDFELIHKELCDLHVLDVEAVKHFNAIYQKHFVNEMYFRTNTTYNVLVSVWIKSSPKSTINHQNNIENVLQSYVEKYNPKQSFLSTNDFKKWENLFTKQKEAAGWSAKGIRRIVQMEKEKRNNLLVGLIAEKKKLDLIQKNFVSKLRALKKEDEESIEESETSLESYLDRKRHYSFIKKTIYYSSLCRD